MATSGDVAQPRCDALIQGHFRVRAYQVRRTFCLVEFHHGKTQNHLPPWSLLPCLQSWGEPTIHREPDNYYLLLRRLKTYLAKYRISLLAYCLLPNHYHFLFRQETEQTISLLMQAIFNSYTKAYNRAYARTGTLFEGPFHTIPVTTDAYLLHICRYIHANPVKHGLADHPADWPYSNYQEWIGERPGTLYDPSFVQAHFPQLDEYRKFVLDYIRARDMPEDLRRYLEALDE